MIGNVSSFLRSCSIQSSLYQSQRVTRCVSFIFSRWGVLAGISIAGVFLLPKIIRWWNPPKPPSSPPGGDQGTLASPLIPLSAAGTNPLPEDQAGATGPSTPIPTSSSTALIVYPAPLSRSQPVFSCPLGGHQRLSSRSQSSVFLPLVGFRRALTGSQPSFSFQRRLGSNSPDRLGLCLGRASHMPVRSLDRATTPSPQERVALLWLAILFQQIFCHSGVPSDLSRRSFRVAPTTPEPAPRGRDGLEPVAILGESATLANSPTSVPIRSDSPEPDHRGPISPTASWRTLSQSRLRPPFHGYPGSISPARWDFRNGSTFTLRSSSVAPTAPESSSVGRAVPDQLAGTVVSELPLVPAPVALPPLTAEQVRSVTLLTTLLTRFFGRGFPRNVAEVLVRLSPPGTIFREAEERYTISFSQRWRIVLADRLREELFRGIRLAEHDRESTERLLINLTRIWEGFRLQIENLAVSFEFKEASVNFDHPLFTVSLPFEPLKAIFDEICTEACKAEMSTALRATIATLRTAITLITKVVVGGSLKIDFFGFKKSSDSAAVTPSLRVPSEGMFVPHLWLDRLLPATPLPLLDPSISFDPAEIAEVLSFFRWNEYRD